jgi:hypothetical protein
LSIGNEERRRRRRKRKRKTSNKKRSSSRSHMLETMMRIFSMTTEAAGPANRALATGQVGKGMPCGGFFFKYRYRYTVYDTILAHVGRKAFLSKIF